MGKHYDLKVGFSCNNKCIHCVIETNREYLLEHKLKYDFSYGEIVKIINSDEFQSSNSITITGGEPTIRKDFDRIVKYLGKSAKNKHICLQTNGRLLHKYLDVIEENIPDMFYVVAIHSIDKNVHDKIVGVEHTGSNSYEETFYTLKKMIEVFGEEKMNKNMRVEIVLSNLNISSFVDTVKYLGDMGINNIGVSYPHADGVFNKYGADGVKKFSIPFKSLKDTIPDLFNYLKDNPKVQVSFEEVPYCMLRDENGELLNYLPNLNSMGTNRGEVNIHLPSSEKVYFTDIWKNLHKQTSHCKMCAIKNHCLGTWFEAIDTFGEDDFVPITESELNKIGGISNVLNYIK